jgi:tRNA 2-thiouridine synthesizing protein B
MTTLHTINKSPFERNSLTSCLRFAVDGCAVLLMEDGVVGAMQGTRLAPLVTEALDKVTIYALGPDIQARGLRENQVIDGIRIVDYDGFVDLTAEHDRVQAWL